MRGRTLKWIFHHSGSLLQPLEFVPEPRKHFIPTQLQVRIVLGQSTSQASVISIQAPQCRRYALISDFLDFAKLSIRDEATWQRIGSRIDLKEESFRTLHWPLLQLQMSSSPKNVITDVQQAINTCESFGLRETVDPSRESIGNCKGFFTACGSP